MKKLLIFLITVLSSTVFFATDVKAETYSFYESEYINAYMTREKGSAKIYQQPRVLRRNGDNRIAYCLQPFLMFDGNTSYNLSPVPENLTTAQRARIEKIAYWGTKLFSPNDTTWYAAAQIMIWKTVDPAGSYYFTQGLNGPVTNYYDNYINTIEINIREGDRKPGFDNKTYIVREDKPLSIYDSSGGLQYFTTNSNIASVQGLNLNVKGLKEGEYTINLTHTFDASSPFYFFNNPSSQNLMTSGTLNPINSMVKIIVKKTKLEVTKIDKDSKSTNPSGEGSLIGAEYDILDKDKAVVSHLTIGKDSKATVENLDFGTYYLKETKAGTGYTLDEELHEFTITEDNPIISLELENEVIKKKIEIHKKYGDKNNFKAEPGIMFNIYNSKGELVDSIITDENGYASIELPYGKYTVKQITSTEGYNKVEDFEINISDSDKDKLNYELLDYIIEVPNTKSDYESNYSLLIIFMMFGVIYVKKEIYL